MTDTRDLEMRMHKLSERIGAAAALTEMISKDVVDIRRAIDDINKRLKKIETQLLGDGK